MTTNEVVIDVEDQNDDEVEAPDKIRSIVWQHFPYKKGAQTSRCNHCKKAIACGTRMGTSGLLNHLRNACHKSGMQATITRMTLTQDEQKKKMAISMKTKYDKYWDNVDNMNYLLYVAVVLDPRNKLAYVSYCIELIHGQGTEKSKEMMGKVTKTLDELFNHYKGKTEKKNGLNSQDTIFDEKSSISEMDIDLELEFDKLDDGGQDIKSEVEIYLGDAREKRDQKFDLLGWWKTNSIKFPILSKLARNVLAMPISTVASESAFSTGGRVIDKYRSSLNPETAEALICAQDWIRCTRVDLELGCSMKNKDIDEFNEKFERIKIGSVSGK